MASVADLHNAIENQDVVCVTKCINSGANINEVYRHETAFTRVAYCYESVNDSTDAIATLILQNPAFDANAGNQFDCTPLHAAASADRVDWLEKLLNMGANVNMSSVRGASPLHTCAVKDNHACAELLIRHGADLNLVMADGRTALYRACENGATKMTRMLIEHGCLVNLADSKGITPLMAALQFHYHTKHGDKKLTDLLDVCETLVRAGSNVNARDNFGKTAIYHVVESNNIYGLCFLAEHGCDVDLEDFNLVTPLIVALAKDSTKYEAARYLLQYGASVNKLSNYYFEKFGSNLSHIKHILERNVSCKQDEWLLTNKTILVELLCELLNPTADITSHCNEDFHLDHNAVLEINDSISVNSTQSEDPSIPMQRLISAKESLIKWLCHAITEPPSLQHRTKLRIRSCLGSVDILRKIEMLPIAARMKRYINLGVDPRESLVYKYVRLHAAILSMEEDRVMDSVTSGINLFACIDQQSTLSLCLEQGSDSLVSQVLQYLSSAKPSESTYCPLSSVNVPSVFSPADNSLFNYHRQLKHHQEQLHPLARMYVSSSSGDNLLHHLARAGRATKHIVYVINQYPELRDQRNFQKRTPLEEAAHGGHFNTAVEMLQLGANPDVSEGTLSLLHLAAASGATRFVQSLLDKGLDPHRTDPYGYFPLDLAISQGRQYTRRGIRVPGIYPSELEESLDFVYVMIRGDDNVPLRSRHSPSHSEIVKLLQAYDAKRYTESVDQSSGEN